VVNNVTVNRVSFNGGPHGVVAAPTPQERTYAQERHIAPTPAQQQHVQQAARNPSLAASANGGHPAIAATPRPGAFNAPGVVGAHGSVAPNARPPGAQPQANAQHPNGQPQANAQHPNGQPQANGQHPNGQPQANAQHPNGQPQAAKPQAAKPQPAKPKPPKNEKHEGDK
jgi:hypothetical protein